MRNLNNKLAITAGVLIALAIAGAAFYGFSRTTPSDESIKSNSFLSSFKAGCESAAKQSAAAAGIKIAEKDIIAYCDCGYDKIVEILKIKGELTFQQMVQLAEGPEARAAMQSCILGLVSQ